MKGLLVFGITAIIVNLPASLAYGDYSMDYGYGQGYGQGYGYGDFWSGGTCPVILTSVTPLSCSASYMSYSVLEVRTVNPRYNAFCHYFTVCQTWPMDTRVVVKVFGAKSANGIYTPIGRTCSFGLTETTHRYYKLLPRWVIDATSPTHCVQQGNYGSDDLGYFRFCDLLSRDEFMQYSYFRMSYSFECTDSVIFNCDYCFQSNY